MRTLEQTDTVLTKDKELLREIKQVIQRFLPEAPVLLYGSVARGAGGPESDYDILVLTDAPISIRQQVPIRNAIFDLELRRDMVVCLGFYCKTEWEQPPVCASPFHENVQTEAIVL